MSTRALSGIAAWIGTVLIVGAIAFNAGHARGLSIGVQHERADAIRANVAEYATVLEGDVPTPRFTYRSHDLPIEKVIAIELPPRTLPRREPAPVPCEQCQREISFGSFKPWNELPEPK